MPRTGKVSAEVFERIMPYPTTEIFWNGIVTTSQGRRYFCVWAGDKPSVNNVINTWKEDRGAFQPYD